MMEFIDGFFLNDGLADVDLRINLFDYYFYGRCSDNCR
jgi:hypothetical protein